MNSWMNLRQETRTGIFVDYLIRSRDRHAGRCWLNLSNLESSHLSPTMTLKRPASPIESSKPSKMTVTAPPASAGLLIKRLVPSAQLPTRGSPLAAGYDLYASSASVVPAGGKALVSTGLSIAVPEGTYGRVAPRSGLASKWSIHTGAGVVDADYRGEVFVLLFNLGQKDLEGECRGLLGDGSRRVEERTGEARKPRGDRDDQVLRSRRKTRHAKDPRPRPS